MGALRAMAIVAAVALLALGAAPCAQAAYEDPDSSQTDQAAEAAVARLGANRARSVGAGTSRISGRVLAISGGAAAVGSGTRAIQSAVLDLAAAKQSLRAQESDLEVHVELPADVLFDVDKADIRADAAQALAQLATVIRGYKGTVKLTGHTDSDGSDEYNMKLSRRRADSVKDWLTAKESIDAARLRTEGKGESQPVVPNDSARNKQRNRRVDVVIRKR